jgi:hypothetical protein
MFLFAICWQRRLFSPASSAAPRLLADPGDLAQAVRLLLDNVEHGFAESAHQLLRIDRPNAADQAGAEIFLDTLDRRRRRRLEKRRPELDPVRAVVDPGTARLNKLARRDHRGMADESDRLALAAGFDPQHAEPVLRVMKGHPVDRPVRTSVELGVDVRAIPG